VFRRVFFIGMAGWLVAQPAGAQAPRVLRLTTADDAGISAAFYQAAANPAPAVILLHGLGTNREEWSSFVPTLQRAGFAVLALDLRGHGESTRRVTSQGPVGLDYRKFAPRDFQDMLLDLDAAFNWLTRQPEVDRTRVAMVGADLGANLALRYASFNDEVAAFLLFSPGLVHQGIRADDVIAKVGHRPLRIVVARDDPFAFESSKRLVELYKQAGAAGATNALSICTGHLHGAALLGSVRDLPAIAVNWLRQALYPSE
jgi:alpha-beta hydrolase superfamily lysophospholipase